MIGFLTTLAFLVILAESSNVSYIPKRFNANAYQDLDTSYLYGTEWAFKDHFPVCGLDFINLRRMTRTTIGFTNITVSGLVASYRTRTEDTPGEGFHVGLQFQAEKTIGIDFNYLNAQRIGPTEYGLLPPEGFDRLTKKFTYPIIPDSIKGDFEACLVFRVDTEWIGPLTTINFGVFSTDEPEIIYYPSTPLQYGYAPTLATSFSITPTPQYTPDATTHRNQTRFNWTMELVNVSFDLEEALVLESNSTISRNPKIFSWRNESLIPLDDGTPFDCAGNVTFFEEGYYGGSKAITVPATYNRRTDSITFLFGNASALVQKRSNVVVDCSSFLLLASTSNPAAQQYPLQFQLDTAEARSRRSTGNSTAFPLEKARASVRIPPLAEVQAPDLEDDGNRPFLWYVIGGGAGGFVVLLIAGFVALRRLKGKKDPYETQPLNA